jgi:putative colanic acid biosynthesis UDP-glucose lipid carrier transferase
MGQGAINLRGAVACPCSGPRHNAADIVRDVHDIVLILDVVIGAVLGYASVQAYCQITAQVAAIPPIGTLMWRELVLISVIAALVVQDNGAGSSADMATALTGVIRRCLRCATILLCVGLATGTLRDMARLWLLIWAAGFLLWMCASRLLILGLEHKIRREGAAREGIVVIGQRATAAELAARLRTEAKIVTVINDTDHNAAGMARLMANLVDHARSGQVGLVILAPAADQPPAQTRRMVDTLKAAPVQIAVYHDLGGLQPVSQAMRNIAGVPLTLVADRPLKPRDLLLKSLFDRCGAAILLVLTAPMLLAVAISVLLETPGPVLFRQDRTGWCGRLFTVYKFRTMQHVPGQTGHAQTMRRDPRCTSVGAFLRRTSLDELPQLWNVLRGDMSLVGPRPHADHLHARERSSISLMADYAQRQRVKPGLTGWAQVHGLRGAADTPEKLRQRLEFDRYYIEHWSIWLDLTILLRTPFAVLSAENAY